MGNTPCTRERIIAVEHILECSSRPLTVPMIVQKVKDIYGIPADIGSVHADIRALKMFYDIRHGGKKVGYYIADSKAEENV
ncbi:MAG: hypothetical protein ACI4XF_05405 [Oscillospiraceae bacterium]